jgi:hypothetical protein
MGLCFPTAVLCPCLSVCVPYHIAYLLFSVELLMELYFWNLLLISHQRKQFQLFQQCMQDFEHSFSQVSQIITENMQSAFSRWSWFQ